SVVVVSYAGGIDAKTMETEVTNPIEQVLGNITGKKGITSTTGDNFTKVVLDFESGSDMKQAKTDVQEALNATSLPTYTSKPTVIQLNTSMIPVSQLAITFDNAITSENLQLIRKTLVPALEDVEGVSRIDSSSEGEAIVAVTFNQEQLAARQIPIPVVLQSLQLSNTASVLSERPIDGKNSSVKLLSNVSTVDALKKTNVAPNTKLADIAKVSIEKKGELISHFNGKEGILLAVIKESSANSVGISKAIDEKITELNKDYPSQEGVVFWTAGENIEKSVYAMATEVLLGALFATIIILVFLRNFQSTFIAIISIPLSLGITVILLDWSGITLNIFTLGGVAVAIGRLVDDSIIVIENIYKKLQNEQLTPTLVIEATKEMSSAIVASTLTTVAVFLPISFVDASLKQFVLPFALTVTYSLLASLLVSLTLVPLLSYTMLKRAKPHHDSLANPTKKIVRWSLKRKGVILTLSALLFVGSIAGYIAMPKGAVDSGNSEFISAVV
ncbi:MAG: efflux RND transporter permease subunit, partial [Bacilli bacterium]